MERNGAFMTLITALFVLAALTLAYNIQSVEASGTIYIRADGSVDPPTAPISSVDNVTYTFTSNIYDSVTVERSNMTIDGKGYTLQGTRAYNSNGIILSGIYNVTIRNLNIKGFYYGLHLSLTFHSVLLGNNITNSIAHGVLLYKSSRNTINGNNITYNGAAGILLSSSSNNIVLGNRLTDNTIGVLIYYGSSNNTVQENKAANNSHYGIELWYATCNNTLFENNITNNGHGVDIFGSSNNTLSRNVMSGNKYHFCIEGVFITNFIHSIDVSNLVDRRPVYYLINQKDITINPATYPQVGYLALINSTNVIVEDLTLKNNGQGLLLAYTNNSRITDNNIVNNSRGVHLAYSSHNLIYTDIITNNNYGVKFDGSLDNVVHGNSLTNNNYGVHLGGSVNNTIHENDIANNYYGFFMEAASRNTIYGNTIENNRVYGLELSSSYDNKFFNNNFIANARQVYSYVSQNLWDNGYPFGGNYWSDYSGNDTYSGLCQNETGYDWIGDSPYIVNEYNRDNYPLMTPYASKTEEERIAYRKLQIQLNKLRSDFQSLNLTFHELLESYDNLRASYNALNVTYHGLLANFTLLNSSYSNLLLEQDETLNKLSTIRNFLYIFIATTIILMAATVYFAKRKLR